MAFSDAALGNTQTATEAPAQPHPSYRQHLIDAPEERGHPKGRALAMVFEKNLNDPIAAAAYKVIMEQASVTIFGIKYAISAGLIDPKSMHADEILQGLVATNIGAVNVAMEGPSNRPQTTFLPIFDHINSQFARNFEALIDAADIKPTGVEGKHPERWTEADSQNYLQAAYAFADKAAEMLQLPEPSKIDPKAMLEQQKSAGCAR